LCISLVLLVLVGQLRHVGSPLALDRDYVPRRLQLSRQRLRSRLGGIGTKPISGGIAAHNQKARDGRDRQHGKDGRSPAAK
jgi:hypothetical protein